MSLLLVLLFFVSLSLIFLLVPKHNKNGHFPAGPKGLPLIGNLHDFNKPNPQLYLYNLSKIYGPILSLRLGTLPVVVVQSAKLAKEVLKTQDHNFCGRPPMVGRQKLSYNGLDIGFSPYNDYFREMKKISIVHLFNSKRVRSFAPIRKDEVSKMIRKISSLASDSKLVNLSDLLMALTSSLTCRIAFGKRYEDEGTERSRFHHLLNEAEAMFAALFISDYFPLMGWLDKLTGQYARLERVFEELDEFYGELISEHLHQDRSKFDGEDIVDVLLQLKKEDYICSRNGYKCSYDDMGYDGANKTSHGDAKGTEGDKNYYSRQGFHRRRRSPKARIPQSSGERTIQTTSCCSIASCT